MISRSSRGSQISPCIPWDFPSIEWIPPYVAQVPVATTAQALPRDDRSRYFKIYKSQIPVIEQAIDTAALMLGTDKSRGYCLEMICADFLAGANLDNGNPDVLLHSISRFFRFLSGEQRQTFLHQASEKAS